MAEMSLKGKNDFVDETTLGSTSNLKLNELSKSLEYTCPIVLLQLKSLPFAL